MSLLKYIVYIFILVSCAIGVGHDLASLFSYIPLYIFSYYFLYPLVIGKLTRSAFMLNLFKSTKSGPVRLLSLSCFNLIFLTQSELPFVFIQTSIVFHSFPLHLSFISCLLLYSMLFSKILLLDRSLVSSRHFF